MTTHHTPSDRGHARRVIVLEINEVSHHLLTKWMGEGALPNFRKFHARSDVFTTMSDVTEPTVIEPWIQWYSIHTGLSYDQHRVFNLTDGRKAGYEDVFNMMMDAGHRVANFHSMNVAPFARAGNICLGDPWTEAGDAWPPEFNAYNRLVGHNVREHTNANASMSARDYIAFASFVARNGMSMRTAAGIIRQLGSEKFGDPRYAWKRASLLDILNCDVFSHNYARYLPNFASFFSNLIAHLQHGYWRYMDPESFAVKPSAEEIEMYGHAIRFAYEKTDDMIGRFLALAEQHHATLMLVSALGQKPFLRYEERGGQRFHRLRDVEAFLRDAGITPRAVSPTMTHQYIARFANPEQAAMARQKLGAFYLMEADQKKGAPIFGFAPVDTDPNDLYFGCQISWTLPEGTCLIHEPTGVTSKFSQHFYQIDGIKSGCHDPEGCLWITREDGVGRVHDDLVSILDILPTQLDLMGVPPRTDLPGRSLAPLIRAPVPA